jgi:predicted type IV restriction endonuclease
MLKLPKKFIDRVADKIKIFQAIAISHRNKDVSEADTVTLIKDVLSDVFGYDKYNELTSEQQIRGTFCDLAVKIDGKIHLLIEVKSAGTGLNDAHLRQAINYGVNQGIEWVVLTNGIDWRLYRLRFAQPVEADQIAAFNLLQINPKNEEHLQRLFLLC